MIISIFHLKGGVGKTSFTYHLAGIAKNSLSIDLDPQASLSQYFQIESDHSLLDVMQNNKGLDEIIQKINEDRFCLPSNIELMRLESYLQHQHKREEKLLKLLDPLRKRYNWILMDLAPNISLLNINALLASDAVIIPTTLDYLGLHALDVTFKIFEDLKENLGLNLKKIVVVPNMVEMRTKIHQQSLEYLKENYSKNLLGVNISKSNAFRESALAAKPVYHWAKYANLSKDFEEILQNLNAKFSHDANMSHLTN